VLLEQLDVVLRDVAVVVLVGEVEPHPFLVGRRAAIFTHVVRVKLVQREPPVVIDIRVLEVGIARTNA